MSLNSSFFLLNSLEIKKKDSRTFIQRHLERGENCTERNNASLNGSTQRSGSKDERMESGDETGSDSVFVCTGVCVSDKDVSSQRERKSHKRILLL